MLFRSIRHMQRTEVLEAEEFFSEGQKGSSSMPHKRNPVLSENITGLARVVRGYVTPARRPSAKSSVTVESGPIMRSTEEWEMSRSCQSVTSSSAGVT